ncbi:MAG: T9SS type A sorting domain-containing protein [Candidatus Cloacimonetes bacterium]|nr:T9SS type A sorting domain-containing protein [Candidatus Cloacimonadota bacterium]
MKKIIILIIVLLICANLQAQKYCSNIHKYLFEEGVKFLEFYKTYEEYEEYNNGNENPRYNEMRNGSADEDEEDWIYGYGPGPNAPSVYITGVGDLFEWFIENELQSITHFWNADNFDVHETNGHNIISGYSFGDEFIVHNIPSAVTKAYVTLFGHNHKVHYKYQGYDAWSNAQQEFTLVNGGSVWLWSLGGVFATSIESICDFLNNQNVYIVAFYNSQGQLTYYDTPYYIHLGDAMWDHFRSQFPYWEYSYLGRIIHLIADMAVPSHTHNDGHAPEPAWVGGPTWDYGNCDQYEGWDFTDNGWPSPTGYGGYLRNNLDNVYWNADLAFQEFSDLIPTPSDYDDPDFLFDLFYSINQVTDMFASDDIDGDFDYHSDHPFNDYPLILEMKDIFENDVLPNYPNIQNDHEITNTGEREAIRDLCIPTAIRGIATFLEGYAQINNFTSTSINYRPLVGHVDINGGSGNTTDVLVTFDKQGSSEDFTIHPDADGNLSITLFSNQFGNYDIIYTLDNYETVTLEDIEIDGNEETLYLPEVILQPLCNVSGHITLSGGGENARPVTNVVIQADNYTTNPDDNGFYSFDIPLGIYDVCALVPGYNIGLEEGIEVTISNTTIVDFNLNYNGYIIVSQDNIAHFTNPSDGTVEALNNETVIIDEGYYNDYLLFYPLTSSVNVTVRGISQSHPENTVIAGDILILCCEEINMDIRYLTFDGENSNETLFSSSGLPEYGEGTINLQGNIIKRYTRHGIEIPDECPFYFEIKDNIIEDCNVDVYTQVNGAGISCESSALILNNIIRNNTIAYSGAPSISHGGGIYASTVGDMSDHIIISINQIYGNSAYEGGAIYCEGDGKIEITGNHIYENTVSNYNVDSGECVGIYSEDYYGELTIGFNCLYHNIENFSNYVVCLDDNQNTLINNNTIACNDELVGIRADGGSVTLLNNIITENECGISTYGCNETIEYCNVVDNGTNYFNCYAGDGCISEPPLFADPGNDDYSLQWNADNFSPCIDTGDPDEQYNDDDGTPSDMGAIPAIAHDYFVNQYDGEVFDRIEWISFPALNRTTDNWMYADSVLFRQELLNFNTTQSDDILDHVLYENVEKIYFYDESWQNNLPPDGDFHSEQGYKFVLQEGYDDIPMKGISGTWENESTPIQLFANKENWVGCFLNESAYLEDAFESISDEWTSIKSEHWAVSRQSSEPTPHIRGTVNPGELYIIRVENDCELIWNNSGNGVEPYIREKTQYFTYEETVDYMPITVDTVYSDTTVTEIAVYSDDQCVGASKVSDGYPVQILAYTPQSLKNGNTGLEFMLLYEGQKKVSPKSIPYIMYSKESQAFIAQPLYYDRKAFARVQLNTDEPSYTQQITLMQNFPNPVITNTTQINFMPEQKAQHTELNIYNLKGQLIRTIDCDGIISSGTKNGYYTLTWDCCDGYGRDVKNGIYFYKLTSGEKSTVNKMLIMK